MGLLRCEICDGQLKKINTEQFECVECGALYSIEEARHMLKKNSSYSSSSNKSSVTPQHINSSTNYVTEVSLGWRKKTVLRITDTQLQWMDIVYPINGITGLNFGSRKNSVKIGHSQPINYSTDYWVVLEINGEEIYIELNNESQYNKVIDILWKLRYVPIMNIVLTRLNQGERVKMDDCYLTDYGIEYKKVKFHFFSKNDESQEIFPWSECGITWKYDVDGIGLPQLYVCSIDGTSRYNMTYLPGLVHTRFYMALMDLAKKYRPTRLSQFLQ